MNMAVRYSSQTQTGVCEKKMGAFFQSDPHYPRGIYFLIKKVGSPELYPRGMLFKKKKKNVGENRNSIGIPDPGVYAE